MRFNIRIDPIWRAGLIIGGATSQNSYVILGDDGMHFRFGLLFNRTIPYDQVAAVFPRSWPFLYGIGWRPNLRGVIGLTGSYHDVVEVRMKQRIGNWAAVFPVDRIAISLEEPEAFIEELSRRTGLAEPPDINALSRPTRRPTRAKSARRAATVVGATGRSPRRPAPKPKAISPQPSPRKPAVKPAAPKAAPTAAKANGSQAAAAPAKAAAPKRLTPKPATGNSNGQAKPAAAKRAPAAANGRAKPQASAPPKAPVAKAAAQKRAVRKAAPSRTAVRARRARGS